ncbi:hypothetical protein G4B88_031573 [Cannabis sativa]|uniref:C3H1-type domain-containing protein n=1 Tax=Cannabis sativa TaxID=3483 RepID=A0A7J6EZG3_CANSA|nr:hypothetical protein G4B88_031573 [Cannabis sativa]
MPVKKDVCRNFQRGSCQYGQRCKFLHVTSSQQQQRPNNVFSYQQQQQQQKPSNPYGFGVQNNPQPKGAGDFGSKPNQHKPFQNSWTRSSSTPNANNTSESQSQTTNHKCTDRESCRRVAVEDFQHERPLWRLTCYGHWKNAPCDIVGDISYEELRMAAYDDAKRGLSLQTIVDRERNLVNSKVIEFENLCKPSAPLSNAFSQKNSFGVSSQTSSAFGTSNLKPFRYCSFSNTSFTSNPITTSTGSNGPSSTGFQQANSTQSEVPSSVDASVWLKNSWAPGEIPEEAPPDTFCC